MDAQNAVFHSIDGASLVRTSQPFFLSESKCVRDLIEVERSLEKPGVLIYLPMASSWHRAFGDRPPVVVWDVSR